MFFISWATAVVCIACDSGIGDDCVSSFYLQAFRGDVEVAGHPVSLDLTNTLDS